jgi:outer membrane protein TolC
MYPYKHTTAIYSALRSSIPLLCAIQLSAQSLPLTLSEALNRARTANPELQALHYQAEAANARIDVAGALPDPTAQFTYFGESVETRTGPQEAIYSLSQTIPWPTKLRTRTKLAAHDAASIARIHTMGQLRIDEALTQAYTEAVYSHEAVQSTETNLQWLDDSRPIIDEQVRGGASLNALLRLEVEMERTRDRLDQLRQEQFAHRTRLASLIGIGEDTLGELAELPLPTSSPPPDASQLLSSLMQNNPELLALKSQIRSASTQTKLSQLERYPDFSVGINYIQVGDNGASASDAGRDPWNLSIAINLPIWEGKNRAAIQSARQTERAAIERYQNRLLQLKAELSATLARHSDNLTRMQRYQEKLIPLARQALENTHTAYEGGQITALEIIESERALLDLKLSYWRAVANALQAEAQIKRLIGAPLIKTASAPTPNNPTL